MKSINRDRLYTRLACTLLASGLLACSGAGSTSGDGLDAAVLDDDAQALVDYVDSSHDVGIDADPVPCDTEDVGSIWGRIYDQETFVPLVGANVCVLNQPQLACATSDGDGIYAIPCVPSGDAEIEYQAAGYPRQLWAWSSRYGINEDVNLGLLPESNHTRFLAPTGQAFPDGVRSLITVDFIGPSDGATVSLRRGSGAGPFYTRYEGGTLDPSLTSIANDHEYAYMLAQAAAGETEIEIAVTPGAGATRCTQYYGGWVPGDGAPNTMRIPVAPDAISVIFLRCE